MANKRRSWGNVCGCSSEKTWCPSSSKKWSRLTRLKMFNCALLFASAVVLLLVTLNFTLTSSSPAQHLKLLQLKLEISHLRRTLESHSQSTLEGATRPDHSNLTKSATDREVMEVTSKELEHLANISQLGIQVQTENDELGKIHTGSQHAQIADRSTKADPSGPRDDLKDLHKNSLQKNALPLLNVSVKNTKDASPNVSPELTKHKTVPAQGQKAANSSTDLYWTELPASLPAWVRFGLRWAEGPMPRGHPHWQVLGRGLEAFLYSAYLDDVVSPPVVRVVGILHKMLSFLNVTCHFYDSRHGPSVHRVSGILYHFRTLNGRKYVGAHADCPLPERNGYLPYAVSLSRHLPDEQANFMIVHYSQSDAWLKKRNYTFYAQIRPGAQDAGGTSNAPNVHQLGTQLGRKWEEAGTGSGWRWNITRCFPAIQRKFNDHVTLAEMVAASLAMGVQRFVFYVESAGPDLQRLLKVLEKNGLAEIYPWNLHMPGNVVFYAAQSSAVQECFYRHLSSSKFLLFGDIDELFVPRQNRSLLALLNEIMNKNSTCGAAVFRNAFFNLNRTTRAPPRTQDPSGYATKHRLGMLTHTRRIAYVWPSPRRTKPAVHPPRVATPGIHAVETFRKGYTLCPLDPAQGLLHHYRIITPKQAGPMQEMDDDYLWQYTPDIIRNFDQLIQMFDNDTKAQP